jgi:hypothetical protein
MKRICLLLLALTCAAGTHAASVTLHPNGRTVILEGRIEVGDFEKVEQLARDAAPTALYLASPGGNLVEAMRIGALVRRLAWETKSAESPSVPPAIAAGVARSYGVRDLAHNHMCASACFFIFVSGIYRDGHRLGIHTPFMLPSEQAKMAADEATKRTDDVQTFVERFLARMGVPHKYFEAMYEVPKEQMRWLTEEEIEADLHGFVPEVRAWVQTQCGDDNQTLRCKDSVMMGIRIRALEQAGR